MAKGRKAAHLRGSSPPAAGPPSQTPTMERGAARPDPPSADPHAALTQAVADVTTLLERHRYINDIVHEVCAMEGRRARLLNDLAHEMRAVWPAARAVLEALQAVLQAREEPVRPRHTDPPRGTGQTFSNGV